MRHLDLFSGIGGFALAAKWAGFETVQFVEIDPFCQKVLRKNFPGVPIHDDIKTFKWTGASPFILTGGFPCQPFSCAGKRGGAEDGRFLWPEMLRVISQVRPTWIVGENVPGIINMELDRCVSDMEAEGYEVQPLIIPACAVNAPHRRDGVWIVGNATSCAEREKRRVCEVQSPDSTRGIESNCLASEGYGEYGECAGKRLIRPGAWQEPWLEAATRLCSLDVRLPGGLVRPKGWRVNALKAVGNSVVPQIPYLIMKGILEVEKELATFNKP
jgi:DNA (cytosine-5)-methyltransferase 1